MARLLAASLALILLAPSLPAFAGGRTASLFDSERGGTAGVQRRAAGSGGSAGGVVMPSGGSYRQRPQRARRSLILGVLDTSASMNDPLPNSGGQKKIDGAVLIGNRTLSSLARATRRQGETRGWFDFGFLEFGTAADGVTPRIQHMLRRIDFDEATGRLVKRASGLVVPADVEETGMNVAKWAKANGRDTDIAYFREGNRSVIRMLRRKAKGNTPLGPALDEAYEVVERHIKDHPDSFPPTVIIISDAQSNVGGDPERAAARLRQLQTSDGHVLVYAAHLTSNGDAVILPVSEDEVDDSTGKMLFRMSSEIPQNLYTGKDGNIRPGARGFTSNAGFPELQRFMEVGTQVHTETVGAK